MPVNGADSFNSGMSLRSRPNWPRAGIDRVVEATAILPSEFVTSRVTVTGVLPGLEIATPVCIEPAWRSAKFPERSAYRRNAFAAEPAATLVSLTVTLPDLAISTTAAAGVCELPEGETCIHPVAATLPVPAVLNRRELREGMEYVN